MKENKGHKLLLKRATGMRFKKPLLLAAGTILAAAPVYSQALFSTAPLQAVERQFAGVLASAYP